MGTNIIKRSSFPLQFVVTYEKEPPLSSLSGFRICRLLGLTITHDQQLPVAIVEETQYFSIIRLGWAFEHISETNRASLTSICDSSTLHFELQNRFHGRFVHIAVNHVTQDATLSADCAGTLSFFNGGGYAFSTCELAEAMELPLAVSKELETAVADCSNSTGYWYSGGFCKFREVRLMFPNHFGELGQGEHTRFWPKTPECLPSITTKTEIASALDDISTFADEVSSVGQLLLPLTAGRDSRILFAALCKRTTNKIHCFCDGETSADDFVYGRVLAQAFDIVWTQPLSDTGSVCLPGFGGEILKGYWYRNVQEGATESERIQRAIPCFHAINSTTILNAFEAWTTRALRGFEDGDRRVLDLAYLEHRWACTMGQVNYQHDRRHGYTFNLFAHPQIIQLGFSLPADIRDRMSAWETLCESVDPALTYLPAGIPHFGKAWPPIGLMHLLTSWTHRTRRRIVYSKAFRRAFKETLKQLTR